MRWYKPVCFLLTLVLLSPAGMVSQAQDSTRPEGTFATRRDFSKGGIGIVNQQLYIVVKTQRTGRNELILKSTSGAEKRWQGRKVGEPEVVFFYDSKIWPSSQGLSDGFDLSRSIVISFEKDKVRFFDFEKEQGAYYERIWD